MADRTARLEELRKIVGDSSIAELEKRTGLNLARENLTSVPPGVCDLTNLVDLVLGRNQLLSLPPEISQLTGLTELSVNSNQLSSLPPEISQLTGLEWLYVHSNQLSSLPPEISRLTGLTYLDVGNNQLSSLPPEISRLTGLKELWVCSNQLSSLPPEISQLTGLTELDVFQNPIEELPPQITALTNLKYLRIEYEGKISIKRAPRGITNLPCWNNTEKPYMGMSYADALRKLQLYDPVLPTNPQPNPTLIPPITTPPIVSTPTTPASPSAPAQPPSDPNSAPVTGDYADVMTITFSPEAILGEGGFGTAYKVQLKKGIVAVKLLKKKAKPDTPEYDELTKEARMMINLRHTNIIGLYAYGCRSQEVFYVMEYADGKSVWDIIEASGALPLDKSLPYSIHINAGLKYLHSQSPPVEHRDLKPENVLICKGVAKICDFGISSARETISRTTGFQGTFHYAAPEYFDTMKGYGPMSDIYTFALVIWVMVAGQRPYDGMNYGQIMNQKMQQKLPVIPPTTPAKLASLMNDSWNYDPRKRPTAEAIEPRLADIKANPGPAVGEKGKSVKDMNNAELVAYLEGKKVLKQFVDVVKMHQMAGEDFVEFTQEDLVADPFLLTGFQAKNIMRYVNEAKLT